MRKFQNFKQKIKRKLTDLKNFKKNKKFAIQN